MDRTGDGGNTNEEDQHRKRTALRWKGMINYKSAMCDVLCAELRTEEELSFSDSN